MKELLINKRRVVKESKVHETIPLSPLVTKFEKWSDKRRKLYFEDDEAMLSKGLQDFRLEENVFASLLASPIRCERMTRHRAPKDILLQLKLKKLPALHGAKHSLQLVPSALHQQGNKSSYVVNSSKLLTKNVKSSLGWIPMPALLSGMRYFNVSDVFVDKEGFMGKYLEETQQCLKSELNKREKYETKLENWSVLVTCEEKDSIPIKILQLPSPEGETIEVVRFNLGRLGCKSWAVETVSARRNHQMGLVLKLPRDEQIVKLIYRLLACFSSPSSSH